MARTKTVRDINVSGKRVFVRVDFNVPLDGTRITDASRIAAAVPTIRHLVAAGAKVILASHLGRPKGGPEAKYSLLPVVADLEAKLGQPVAFAESCVGPVAEAAVAALQPGQVLLLENVRFEKGEEKNDPALSKIFASYADIFVNDAFGTAHRAHASTAGIAEFIAGPKVCGFLIEKELAFLGEKTAKPDRPFVVLLGGAKVSDKIPVIDRLLDKADTILIGGAMAYTFALAQGRKVGKSLCEPDKVDMARAALAKAAAKGVKFLLPVDTNVTDSLDFKGGKVGTLKTVEGDIPDGWEGVDIGPKTVAAYAAEIAGARTVLWNGPMGIFEIEACSVGTFSVARAVAANRACTSIIGGGDSVTAINAAGLGDQVTFMSTGGGASLEFLEGKALPGVEVLDKSRQFLIAGNWKMNKTPSEGAALAKEIVAAVGGDASVEVVVCPPFTALDAVGRALGGSVVQLGAQNVHAKASGAFTGEVSTAMLKDVGASWVILGHSERRVLFGEKDAGINEKVKATLAAGLRPILCVGETLEERDAGTTLAVVKTQLAAGLAGVDAASASSLVIAYEPVWAIGTGRNATPEQAQEVHAFIRAELATILGAPAAATVRILYGGSMKPDNAAGLLAKEDIDGGLIGGASLEAKSFFALVAAARTAG